MRCWRAPVLLLVRVRQRPQHALARRMQQPPLLPQPQPVRQLDSVAVRRARFGGHPELDALVREAGGGFQDGGQVDLPAAWPPLTRVWRSEGGAGVPLEVEAVHISVEAGRPVALFLVDNVAHRGWATPEEVGLQLAVEELGKHVGRKQQALQDALLGYREALHTVGATIQRGLGVRAAARAVYVHLRDRAASLGDLERTVAQRWEQLRLARAVHGFYEAVAAAQAVMGGLPVGDAPVQLAPFPAGVARALLALPVEQRTVEDCHAGLQYLIEELLYVGKATGCTEQYLSGLKEFA